MRSRNPEVVVRTVNVQDAKTHLSRLLRAVESGEQIAIARAGRVIARLVRAEEGGGRRLGGFVGQVSWDEEAFDAMSDDEAAPWTDGALLPEDPYGGI